MVSFIITNLLTITQQELEEWDEDPESFVTTMVMLKNRMTFKLNSSILLNLFSPSSPYVVDLALVKIFFTPFETHF